MHVYSIYSVLRFIFNNVNMYMYMLRKQCVFELQNISFVGTVDVTVLQGYCIGIVSDTI